MLSAIKFNTTEIPFLSTWEESYVIVETQGRTEAGTDQIIVNRETTKLEVNAGGVLLSSGLAAIEAFILTPSFTLTLPNGDTRTVRMRDFKKTLKPRTEKLTATDGIWSVSFRLIEF